MKKVLLSFAIILTLNISIYAQSFSCHADTAYYLMNEIEGKKNLYIGKPFEVLLDSLKIKPINFVNGSILRNNYGITGRFYFNFEEDFQKSHYIIVDFESVPSYNVLSPIFYPSLGKFGKLEDIIQVYKPLIVKDVVTKDYYADLDDVPILLANTSTQRDAAITAQQKAINTKLSFYRDKPFYVLWEELQIKPKTIWGKTSTTDNMKESATQFFYETSDKLSISHFLITWMDPIPKTVTQRYQLSVIRDFRNPREFDIYSDKIIKDIKVIPEGLNTTPPSNPD